MSSDAVTIYAMAIACVHHYKPQLTQLLPFVETVDKHEASAATSIGEPGDQDSG